jgi:hypothetical protein
MACINKQTILTKRLLLAGEVSANFCGKMGATWSVQWIPTAVFSVF